jgi:elongation factor 3
LHTCSGFLDNVCTDIIHYEKRQLRRYKGNLSEFVKQVPAAKSYYELEAASLKFRFPTPGLLDGISSKEKPICKLSNVVFTYPGATVPQLTDVNVAARLSSRVAVIGVNGAGKSVSDGCTWQYVHDGVLLWSS